MKIKRVDLRDFRQFHGHEHIEFATDDTRNVTLVHAENGVGKTTLLNAVFWALYNRTTPRFEQRSRLVNFETEALGGTEASVEVSFEFDGADYRAMRRHVNGESEPKLTVFHEPAGTPLQAPETFIGTIIPTRMAEYFFFDGEHAEAFAGELNRGAGPAIRSMLGCDLAERAIADLKDVAASYTRQAGSMKLEAEIETMRVRMSGLEADQDRDERKLVDLDVAIQGAVEQKAVIEEQLRQMAGAKEIQELRDELNGQLEKVQGRIADAEGALVRWVSERGTVLVGRRLAKEVLDFIDAEQIENRLPSPYNESFIQGLLTKGKCICCHDLKPETVEWRSVAALLENAGTPGALNKVVRAKARLLAMHDDARRAPEDLRRIEEQAAAAIEERRSLEHRIGEESKKLVGYKVEEVREREAARIALETEIRTKSEEKGGLERVVAERAQTIGRLANDIETRVKKNDRAKVIFGKRRLALDASDRLVSHLQKYETDARADIERQINEILAIAARRDYRFHFAEDFSMSLSHRDFAGPIPKSGGENQLMSLAFTAALVAFAKSRVGMEDAILTPGTVAPLVLDAPIGHLDKSYRRATAEFLPEMAGQVVLLLSSSHTGDGVLDALRPRIGAEYVLISENRSERQGRSDDEIVVGGRSIARSLFGQEINRTRIERVA